MIDKGIIGRESNPVITRIEEDSVRRFCEAIGASYEGEVPPTFVITLKSGSIPGLEMPEMGLIHANQKFTYNQRISIGDVVTCTRRIVDIFERQGKLGRMIFVVQAMEGRNIAGDLMFNTTSTLIVREEE